MRLTVGGPNRAESGCLASVTDGPARKLVEKGKAAGLKSLVSPPVKRPPQTLLQAFGKQAKKPNNNRPEDDVGCGVAEVTGALGTAADRQASAVEKPPRGSSDSAEEMTPGGSPGGSTQRLARRTVVDLTVSEVGEGQAWEAYFSSQVSVGVRERVAAARFITGGDIYTRGDESLAGEDLRRLQGRAFLRDEVIDIMGAMVRAAVRDVYVFSVWTFNDFRRNLYLGRPRGVNVRPRPYRLWMFPVNVGGSHWVLLVADLATNVVGYYDSMYNQDAPPPDWVKHVGTIVNSRELRSRRVWRCVTMNTGQQSASGNDCAIAVIHNFMALALGRETVCDAGRYRELRVKVFVMVLQYSLAPDEAAIEQCVAAVNVELARRASVVPEVSNEVEELSGPRAPVDKQAGEARQLRKRKRENAEWGALEDGVVLQQVAGYEHENVGFATSTIPNAGNGLFVTKRVRGGQFICSYPGVVVSIEQIMAEDYVSQYCSAHGEDSDTIIDAKDPKWGHGRLANDSLTDHLDNGEIRRGPKGYGVYALPEVEVDERHEVFVAYGGEFYVDESFDLWLREAAAAKYPEHKYRILHCAGEGDCEHADCIAERRQLMKDWEQRIMRDGHLKNYIPRLVQKRNLMCRRSGSWDKSWRMHGDGSGEAKPMERSELRKELMELDSFSDVYCKHESCRVDARKELKRKRESDTATIDELWCNRLCRIVKPRIESIVGVLEKFSIDLG